MVKKQVTTTDNVKLGIERFIRAFAAAGGSSLILFLQANNFDMKEWKTYLGALVVAVFSGAWMGGGKFLKEQYPTNWLIKALAKSHLI